MSLFPGENIRQRVINSHRFPSSVLERQQLVRVPVTTVEPSKRVLLIIYPFEYILPEQTINADSDGIQQFSPQKVVVY